MTVVLDSWAVLRYLEGVEPAASEVERLLDTERPLMSWLNLGEVFYVLHRTHGEVAAEEAVRDLRTVLDAEVATPDRVLGAGRIQSNHRLAYADAFAAATAEAHAAPLWTGDPQLLVDDAPWTWVDLR